MRDDEIVRLAAIVAWALTDAKMLRDQRHVVDIVNELRAVAREWRRHELAPASHHDKAARNGRDKLQVRYPFMHITLQQKPFTHVATVMFHGNQHTVLVIP